MLIEEWSAFSARSAHNSFKRSIAKTLFRHFSIVTPPLPNNMMFSLAHLSTLVIVILSILVSGLDGVVSDSKVNFSVEPEASSTLPNVVCIQCFIV